MILIKKIEDIEVSENSLEAGTSLKSLPEPSAKQYDRYLYAQWKNYFTKADYRKGGWNGKKEILIPLMDNNFSSQMQFSLSADVVMVHLKKRHPELVQKLACREKQDIKDADDFKVMIARHAPDVHNLIFELASQLSDKEAILYKSEFHIDIETNTKLKNPTIMIRTKNKEGHFLLSAWGLYEAEKNDGIKFHLLSCYPDNNGKTIFPKNAIKIFDIADNVRQKNRSRR